MFDDEEDLTYVLVTGLIRDEGSVVVFEGVDNQDLLRFFACERRYALDLVFALQSGELPEAAVASWQFVGGA